MIRSRFGLSPVVSRSKKTMPSSSRGVRGVTALIQGHAAVTLPLDARRRPTRVVGTGVEGAAPVLKEQRKTTRLRSSWKPTRTPRAPLPRPTTVMRHSRTFHPSPRVLAAKRQKEPGLSICPPQSPRSRRVRHGACLGDRFERARAPARVDPLQLEVEHQLPVCPLREPEAAGHRRPASESGSLSATGSDRQAGHWH